MNAEESSSFDPTYRISDEPWYKMNVFKWALYDLGNTIFSMAVVSLTILPLIQIMYFNKGYNGDEATHLGNIAISVGLLITNLVMAVVSPFLGGYADQQKTRKPLLIKLSIVCITFMAALYASAFTTNPLIIVAIFVLANLFYQMGLVVYDATLPFITDSDSIGKVAGFGVALGYLGSFIGIGIGYALIPFYGDYEVQVQDIPNGVLQDNFQIGYIPHLFPYAAFMFLLFTIPLITLREKVRPMPPTPTNKIITNVYHNVKATGKEIFKNKDMKFFLIGWLIFVDAANTVIVFMSPMITQGLEFGKGATVIIVLALGIGSAVLLTYPVGIFVDKYGPKKGLWLITLLWIIAVMVAMSTNINYRGIHTPEWPVYLFPFLVGPALGGTWVVQRQYITELSPPEKVGNYFGFSNIFGRISAAFGPTLWTASILFYDKSVGLNVNMATRVSMSTIIILMLIGFFIILPVVDPHKAYLEGGRSDGNGKWIDKAGNVLLDTSQK